MTPQPPYVPGPSHAQPEQPFTLQQMASTKRRLPWRAAAVVAAVILAAGGGYWLAQPDAKSIDGVEAPNELCRADIESIGHPWVKNGWWVGYVNGEVKSMVSSDAQALSMAGYEMSGIWLCPPKSEW